MPTERASENLSLPVDWNVGVTLPIKLEIEEMHAMREEMNIKEIHLMAQRYQIKTDGLSKNEIICAIQMQNGQGKCFATNYGNDCRYIGCYWREECFDAAMKQIMKLQ